MQATNSLSTFEHNTFSNQLKKIGNIKQTNVKIEEELKNVGNKIR